MTEIGDWIGDHLCVEENILTAIQDVQLHPLRCNLYIKFSEEVARDTVADRLARVEHYCVQKSPGQAHLCGQS